MKITFIKENRDAGTESISTCDTDTFIAKIKSETKARYVSGLRAMLEYTGRTDGGAYESVDRLPRICPAMEYGRTREGERRMKRYNGIVLLEAGGLSGLSEVEQVKEQAALLPQTYAAFAGSSGRSVKIWALFALPDGRLPQREEEIALFHAHAYRMAVQCYQPLLPFPLTLKEPSHNDTFRMTLDETPYFAPDAVPFCLEQPVTMPGEQTFGQHRLAEKNPLKRLQPGYESSQTFTFLFEAALNRALDEVENWRGLGNKMHANSTSPLLIGAQGYRKSTFCRIILPPELRFGYTDSLDFGSKRDAEMYLGRFLLVNIDEFDQVSIHQQGFLKHLLQKPVANLRKPYGSSIQEMRRYASFIGTSNHKDLLTDSSGSRRFVCVEVTAPIDTNVTINYRQLYAQAMQAIRNGERYWFDDEDESVLKETNREFEQISPIEQMFHCYFRLPEEGEEGIWMSPIQILEYLHTKNSNIKFTEGYSKHFGRILKKNSLESRHTNKGTVYRIVKS